MFRLEKCFNEIGKKIRSRYKYILLFIISILFFSIIVKDKNVDNYGDMGTESKIDIEYSYNQNIYFKHINPEYINIKVQNQHKGKFKYNINLFDGDKRVLSQKLTSDEVNNTELYSIFVGDINFKNLNNIKIEINKISGDSNISLYIDNSNSNIYLDGKDINKTAIMQIQYGKFSLIYISCLLLVCACGIIFILYVNVDKIHNSVFGIIISIGIISAIVNPILDIPDEQCHLARAELTSRGILFLKDDWEEYKISDSVSSILQNQFTTLENTPILDSTQSNKLNDNFDNYANANIFISYIPMTLGLILGKLIVAFGGSSISILLLGRIANLLFYAIIVRYAIKKAPSFKLPLSVIALMPMSIFIAASFNPDGVTYSLALLLISYFLYIYKKEDMGIKEIRIFTIISIILGLVKLPYCLLGGLILFIPKKKYISNKVYLKTYVYVSIIALVSLAWAGFSIISSSNSPYADYYLANGIDAKEQIKYILNNPVIFTKNFIVQCFNNINGYLEQLSTFGWLTYNWGKGLVILYPIFIASVVIFYPTDFKFSKKTKIGISIISIGIFLSTCLILYMTWNSVGSSMVVGVQGRYFIPLIAILTLLTTNNEMSSSKKDYKYIIISCIFLCIYIMSVMNRYY